MKATQNLQACQPTRPLFDSYNPQMTTSWSWGLLISGDFRVAPSTGDVGHHILDEYCSNEGQMHLYMKHWASTLNLGRLIIFYLNHTQSHYVVQSQYFQQPSRNFVSIPFPKRFLIYIYGTHVTGYLPSLFCFVIISTRAYTKSIRATIYDACYNLSYN